MHEIDRKELLRVAVAHGMGEEVAGMLMESARNLATDAPEWVTECEDILATLRETESERGEG